MYISDVDGNRYLDASGGAAVSCLGHGDHVLLAPPYIADISDMKLIVDRLGMAVDDSLREIGAVS